MTIKNEIQNLGLSNLKSIEKEFGEFDVKKVNGGSNDVYLRFGYWRRINVSKLQQIIGDGIRVVEDYDYDDDCGNLFSYNLQRI